MSARDYFVAGVALTLAILSLLSALRVPAVGLEQRAYRLRTVRSVQQRWGDGAARLMLLMVAALMFAVGISIVAQGQSMTGTSSSLPKNNRR